MNAKKCKVIRRNVIQQVRQLLMECGESVPDIEYRSRKFNAFGKPMPIRMDSTCIRATIKDHKRSADPRWMKKVY
jgi:hypothetical protein